jgi:hypothetical protein
VVVSKLEVERMLFVSYTRVDRDIIGTLLADLRALGHVVWLDEELSGGQVWWDEILARIQQCDALLFMVSPASVESEACLLELQYAIALNRIVIPVNIVETSPMTMPSALETHQVINYRSGDKSETMALARALTQTESDRPLPDPLPQPPSLPGSYFGSIRDQIKSRDPLGLDQQLGLIHRVRTRADEGATDDVVALLHGLRERDDLFATVATQIDALLVSLAPPPDPVAERRKVGFRDHFRRPVALSDRMTIGFIAVAIVAGIVAMGGDLWRVDGNTWISWNDGGVDLQRAHLAALLALFVVLAACSFSKIRPLRWATSLAALGVSLVGLLVWWWGAAIVDGLLLEHNIASDSGPINLGIGLTASGLSMCLLVVAGVLLTVSAFSEQSA